MYRDCKNLVIENWNLLFAIYFSGFQFYILNVDKTWLEEDHTSMYHSLALVIVRCIQITYIVIINLLFNNHLVTVCMQSGLCFLTLIVFNILPFGYFKFFLQWWLFSNFWWTWKKHKLCSGSSCTFCIFSGGPFKEQCMKVSAVSEK